MGEPKVAAGGSGGDGSAGAGPTGGLGVSIAGKKRRTNRSMRAKKSRRRYLPFKEGHATDLLRSGESIAQR